MDFLFSVPDFAQLRDPMFFWGLAVLCAFSIGFSKNGVTGAGVLVIPLMAHIFPAKASTGILLPMLVAGDCVAMWTFRGHGDWRHVFKALPWAFAGIIAGWLAMMSPGFSGEAFKIFIGAIVVCVLALGEWLAWRRRKAGGELRISHSPSSVAFFGLLGGFATMTANAAGPVFAIYLLALELPKENFIGSTARIFFILNLVKIPFSAQLGLITPGTLSFNAILLPFLLAGAYAGFKTAKIIPQRTFNSIVKLLALAAAVKLML